MYIKLLLGILLGYVRIQVEGYYVERFINICISKKIFIWNLKRKKSVKLLLNIGIKDFKKISDISKKSNCKIKIIKKRGVPFLLHRYKKRKIFVLFLLIISLLIFISSRYIWNIEVSVKDNLTIENIENDLKKLGLKQGVLKKSIDSNKIINDLRLNRSDIAWVRN